MDLIIENLLGQAGGNFKGLIFGFVHVAIMIVGYYTGFSINKFLKILSNGYVAGIFGIVLSHIIADIIACYLDPDLRKMIFGVVIGGIIPLFLIPVFEKFVVKSKQSFLDETKNDLKRPWKSIVNNINFWNPIYHFPLISYSLVLSNKIFLK